MKKKCPIECFDAKFKIFDILNYCSDDQKTK